MNRADGTGYPLEKLAAAINAEAAKWDNPDDPYDEYSRGAEHALNNIAEATGLTYVNGKWVFR